MIAKSIKPIDPRTILQVLDTSLGARGGAVTGKRALDRLLVVEDNPGDARLLQVLFDEQGSPTTKVKHVTCMKDAEAYLASNPVDIILLDLGLPDADGLGAVRRAHAAAPNVPLVVLTGLDDETIATQALQEGAQDYLVKGQIETRGLLRALRYSVERKALEEALVVERELARAALLADLSERKRAQEALEEARRRLDHVVSSSPVVLFQLEVRGDSFELRWMSKNVETLLGYPVGEVSTQWWHEGIHPADRARAISEVRQLFTEEHVVAEYRFKNAQGQYQWLGTELRLLRDPHGRPVEAVGSWASIAARKATELRLLESEEQYRVLFDSNPHPMYVVDAETLRFLAVNDAALVHYGYSRPEFLAIGAESLRRPDQVPALIKSMADARLSTAEAGKSLGVFEHLKKNGETVQMEIAASHILFNGRAAFLALALDVTAKQNLEAQLRQAQKMESIGRLAGGVAHDFNNILGVITGYGELLARRLPHDPRLHKYATDIVQASARGAGLTRQLLAFSRNQVLKPTFLDLNVVVSDMERMLRRLIGENIQLVTAFEERLWAVKADAGQMEQILMNLAVNARDAMPGGGRLEIETANVELDSASDGVRAGAKPGPYAVMCVSDTGHGMTKEVQARLFEPFFTTKEQGKGTGLGLATVHGIVQQSGGHIWVVSELGQGTTFKMYFPSTEIPAEAGVVPEAEPELPQGTETVLLVEDEQSLREIVRECLESTGYTVLDAKDGNDALDLCGRHAGTIHLLMTDVVMPGIGGRVLAERLQALRPGLRTLYMSGYTDDAVVLHGVLAARMAFLQKPFTARALAVKVRSVLDAPR